jgi:hypothetical protein
LPSEAATRILSLYDAIPAVDGRLFAVGLAELLSQFPQSVIDLAANPGRGLASHIDFPSLAKFRKKLNEWNADYFETVQRDKARKLKALPPPPEDPEVQARIARNMAELVNRLKATAGAT